MADRRAARRLRVRFDEHAFALDVGRYGHRTPAREAAERAREIYASEGVDRAQLEPCAAEGRDGTQLAGRVKVYLPPDATEPPFRMLFSPVIVEARLELAYLAFGVGHQPKGSRAPTVYEIAHRRIHGEWPGT
ncbi:MAG: hypothetical protein ACR2ML_05830 [Solirubrobacteraceae bacterium]